MRSEAEYFIEGWNACLSEIRGIYKQSGNDSILMKQIVESMTGSTMIELGKTIALTRWIEVPEGVPAEKIPLELKGQIDE
jgi:hypothetical protein